MSRLLDRILRDPLLASRLGSVEGLPVIDASSVADLYAESPTMGVEEATWPNAAPPFPACWLEFRAPREVVLGPGQTQAWGLPWPRSLRACLSLFPTRYRTLCSILVSD